MNTDARLYLFRAGFLLFGVWINYFGIANANAYQGCVDYLEKHRFRKSDHWIRRRVRM
ncbi:hypothetical protein [Shewanella benthica]|uniref:hypothetical protein n=1 Tax=Shewanella benthica TaxID=43661 RepID=UPI001879FDA3|nr:hypothetical protein [Shewanella benthica]